MVRIVFMGTPAFAVPALMALHQRKDHSIIGVYTQPDRPVGRGLEVRASPVKQKAQVLKLPVFQPEKLSQPGEFEKLQALNPDVIVIVAYGQILKKPVLELPRMGCINIHSSLLPAWRGAAPIHWALLAGDRETGVTTMRLVEKLDAGDVLLQERTPIQDQDTVLTLHDRLADMGGPLIVETLKRLQDGTLTGTPQDETKVSYAAKLTKEMEWLDPTQNALVLWRRIRALNPWPGTSVRIGSNRLKIKAAIPRMDIQEYSGTIFEKAGMVLLGTADGSLELQRVQWDGKQEINMAEFLNGLRGRGQALPLKLG